MKRKSKLLAAAIAMLALSTAASVTGTVAWFTAANTVNVAGMSIKAETEQGIVIADQAATYTDASWVTDVAAENTGAGLSFIPTSTSTLSAWYHNNASSVNDYAGANAYETITGSLTDVVDANDGYYVASNTGIDGKKVYLVNTFYIQSSGADLTNQYLFVKDLAVTGDAAAHTLSRALRVGFLCNGATTIYAPIADATATYNVFNSVDNTDPEHPVNTYDSVSAVPSTALASKIVISGESNATKITVPEYLAAGNANKIRIDVFAYFEGEDHSCTSAAAALGLDTLALSFKIGNTGDTTGLVFDY